MDEYLLQTGKYLAQAGSNINDANKLLKTNQKQMENIQKKYHKIWAYIDAELRNKQEITDRVNEIRLKLLESQVAVLQQEVQEIKYKQLTK